MEKQDLRDEMRRRRRALGPDEVARRSSDVAAGVRALPEWEAARTVALYAATDGEPDMSGLADASKRFCFPRVEGDRLAFCEATPASLAPARFGIPAPPAGASETPRDSIDLYVVPGLAFDAEGRRLGRGGGYYDGALRLARGAKVGVAWDFQIVESVPERGDDVRVDAVVTESRVLRRVS